MTLCLSLGRAVGPEPTQHPPGSRGKSPPQCEFHGSRVLLGDTFGFPSLVVPVCPSAKRHFGARKWRVPLPAPAFPTSSPAAQPQLPLAETSVADSSVTLAWGVPHAPGSANQKWNEK